MRQRALTFAPRGAFLRSRARRAALTLGAVAALLAAPLAGCGSTPTLPLPPPVASVGAPNLQGLVRVEGQANEEAYVTVLNESTDTGKIGRADVEGHFAIDIAASVGDSLLIWQELDGVSGERNEQTVPAPVP